MAPKKRGRAKGVRKKEKAEQGYWPSAAMPKQTKLSFKTRKKLRGALSEPAEPSASKASKPPDEGPTTFLSLPYKLRRRIYTSAETFLTPTHLDPNLRYRVYAAGGPDARTGRIVICMCGDEPRFTLAQPAITQTCRQIRRETLRIFYGENGWTFKVLDGGWLAALVEGWHGRLFKDLMIVTNSMVTDWQSKKFKKILLACGFQRRVVKLLK